MRPSVNRSSRDFRPTLATLIVAHWRGPVGGGYRRRRPIAAWSEGPWAR